MTDFATIKQQVSAALNATVRNNPENKVNCFGISLIQALEGVETMDKNLKMALKKIEEQARLLREQEQRIAQLEGERRYLVGETVKSKTDPTYHTR